MISFEDFRQTEGVPLYQQLLLHIKRGAVAGKMVDGDELPSRRILSVTLGINPNTVQKAYRCLEEEGLVFSHTGAKSILVLDEQTLQKLRKELTENDVRQMVLALKTSGVTEEEATSLIHRIWKEDLP